MTQNVNNPHYTTNPETNEDWWDWGQDAVTDNALNHSHLLEPKEVQGYHLHYLQEYNRDSKGIAVNGYADGVNGMAGEIESIRRQYLRDKNLDMLLENMNDLEVRAKSLAGYISDKYCQWYHEQIAHKISPWQSRAPIDQYEEYLNHNKLMLQASPSTPDMDGNSNPTQKLEV